MKLLNVAVACCLAVACAAAETVTGTTGTFACELTKVSETNGVRCWKMTCPSAGTFSYSEGRTIVAWYYEPVAARTVPGPAVVCLHILGGDGSLTRALASHFAASGLPALAPEMPLFLNRAPAGSRRATLERPNGPSLLAESFNAIPGDLRRSADFLASRPGVDAKRLRIMGTSLGGILAVTGAGKDDRFEKAAFLLAGGDLKGLLAQDRPEVQPIAEAIARADAATRTRLDAAFAALEPLNHVSQLRARVEAGNVRLVSAGADEVVPAVHSDKLAAALGLKPGAGHEIRPGLGHYTAIAALPELADELATWFGGTPAVRDISNDAETIKGFFAELAHVAAWEPAKTAESIEIEADFSVREAGLDPRGGHICVRRGTDGRWAVVLSDGRGFDKFKNLSLGRGRAPWIVSSDGTVFVGDGPGGAALDAKFTQKTRMIVQAARMFLSMMARQGSLRILDTLAQVRLETDASGGRRLCGRGKDFSFTVRLAHDRLAPTSIEVVAKGTAVSVVVRKWNTRAPLDDSAFAPPSSSRRRVVSAVLLEKALTAFFAYVMDRAGVAPARCASKVGEGRGLRLGKRGEVPLMFLAGSPEEMGRQHGSLFASEIRALHDRVLVVAAGYLYAKNDWFFDRIREIEHRTKAALPARYMEELDAMGTAAGLTHEETCELGFFPEIFHCSGIAARGKATVGGEIVHARVLDYMSGVGIQDVAAIQVFMPKGFNTWLSVGFAGLNGTVTAFNEKGLAMGEMGGRGEGKWDGLPMTYLMRQIMEECDTVAAAVKFIKATPLTCDYYYVLSDASGDMVTIEAKAGMPLTVLHAGEKHRLLLESFDDVVWVTAPKRQKALCERLREYYGRIDVATMKEVVKRPVAMKSNLQNAIFLPRRREVHFSYATSKNLACDVPYTVLRLADLLETYRLAQAAK